MRVPPHVRVERSPRSASVILDRAPVNVLDTRTLDDLASVFEELARDGDLHGVALRAAGRCFSAGADVAEHLPPAVENILASLRRLLLAVDRVPVPTIAVIHGAALGGGLEVALACDRRIAAADARLGNPEIQLGVIAPAAAVLLPDLIGTAAAFQFLCSGTEVSAARALELGLVDRVVDPRELDAALEAELSDLAARSRVALMATKKAIRFGARSQDLQDRLEAAEALYLEEIARSPDALASLRAFTARKKQG